MTTAPGGARAPGEPRLSIVTVVRNDRAALERTAESVARWRGPATEFVVLDGASTDGTAEVARRVADVAVSEPDRGIYDAMNKGTRTARGRFLQFLNAGDLLVDAPEEVVAAAPDDAVLVYAKANMRYADGTLRYVKGKRLWYAARFLKGMPLCHQAIFYRRDVMPEYDLTFPVLGDRVLTYELVRRFGLRRTLFVDRVVVDYFFGGFSNHVPPETLAAEQERFYRRAGKPHYIAYKRLNAWFRSEIREPWERRRGKRERFR